MSAILLDPVLVMTPPQDATEGAVQIWLSHMDRWLTEALSAPHTWQHSLACTEQILSTGRFPDFNMLRTWQRRYRIDSVNIVELHRKINHFFNSIAFDLISTTERLGYLLVFAEGSIEVGPIEVASRWDEPILREISRVLATISACKQANDDFACDLSMATPPLITSKSIKEINVSATIVDSIPELELGVEGSVQQSIPVVFSPDDLPPPQDFVGLFRLGEEAVVHAIRHWARVDWPGLKDDVMPVRLGHHFLRSVKSSGVGVDGIVLGRIVRATAAVVVGMAKDSKSLKLRQLRETETADSAQRVRVHDGARAWRITLTQHGAGWRMHYWEVRGASEGIMIELANVLKKQDPEIIL